LIYSSKLIEIMRKFIKSTLSFVILDDVADTVSMMQQIFNDTCNIV